MLPCRRGHANACLVAISFTQGNPHDDAFEESESRLSHHRPGVRAGAAVGCPDTLEQLWAQAVSDDQILDAIHHQVNYLLSQKQQNNWEAREKYGGMFFAPGSQTSMVLYSLLYAGQYIDDKHLKSNSPELKPAIVWVCKVDPTFTYTAAMQANALALVQDVMHVPLYRNALSHAAQCLVNNVGLNGAYSYTWNPPVQHQLRPLERASRSWG